jgi:hypothetical protein
MPPRNSRNWVERMIGRNLHQFLSGDFGAEIAIVG